MDTNKVGTKIINDAIESLKEFIMNLNNETVAQISSQSARIKALEEVLEKRPTVSATRAKKEKSEGAEETAPATPAASKGKLLKKDAYFWTECLRNEDFYKKFLTMDLSFPAAIDGATYPKSAKEKDLPKFRAQKLYTLMRDNKANRKPMEAYEVLFNKYKTESESGVNEVQISAEPSTP